MFWWIVACSFFAGLAGALLYQNLSMKKALEEMQRGFSEKIEGDTNTLISISSNDKVLCRFAGELNAELKKLRKERLRLQQGDLELRDAVTNISHDLRTPLTAICSYLDLLEAEEKSDTVARYIAVIENRVDAMKQLTEELFRYTILLSSKQETQAEPVVLNAVLEESIAGYYAALWEHHITPDIRITEHAVKRNCSKASLSRIFCNILSNAIKYSDGDLEITLTEAGEITFTNTASQLDKVQVGQLFDRFYTVEAAGKSTGLGLAIAKALTEQMEGTISAKYENGRLSICMFFPNT